MENPHGLGSVNNSPRSKFRFDMLYRLPQPANQNFPCVFMPPGAPGRARCRVRFVLLAAYALLTVGFFTIASFLESSTYISEVLFENDIDNSLSVGDSQRLALDTLGSGSAGNTHGLGSVHNSPPNFGSIDVSQKSVDIDQEPLDDSLGFGVSPAEFEAMLCYNPSARRIELSPPPTQVANPDKPEYTPIYINGGGTKHITKYEHITRLNYSISIISTPVVVIDFIMVGSNLYHNGQHLFPLFSNYQLPGNFQWVGDAQVVDIVYVKQHGEMKFGTIPFYAKVALGGGVDVRMKLLSQYNDGSKNAAVCFKDARLPYYTKPLFKMTDDGQCSHAYFREKAYKSCGIVAPSAPPKTVTVYQRTQTRRLLDENKLASTVQTLLGSEWKVNILVHDQAMPMCNLVRALAGTGVLITPHGFQVTNAVFLPYGAQFVEIFPSGYERDCFQELGSTLDHVGAWSTVSTLPKPAGCTDTSSFSCRSILRGVDVQVDYKLLPELLEGVVSSLEKNGGDENDACLPAWGGWGPRNLGREAS